MNLLSDISATLNRLVVAIVALLGMVPFALSGEPDASHGFTNPEISKQIVEQCEIHTSFLMNLNEYLEEDKRVGYSSTMSECVNDEVQVFIELKNHLPEWTRIVRECNVKEAKATKQFVETMVSEVGGVDKLIDPSWANWKALNVAILRCVEIRRKAEESLQKALADEPD